MVFFDCPRMGIKISGRVRIVVGLPFVGPPPPPSVSDCQSIPLPFMVGCAQNGGGGSDDDGPAGHGNHALLCLMLPPPLLKSMPFAIPITVPSSGAGRSHFQAALLCISCSVTMYRGDPKGM